MYEFTKVIPARIRLRVWLSIGPVVITAHTLEPNGVWLIVDMRKPNRGKRMQINLSDDDHRAVAAAISECMATMRDEGSGGAPSTSYRSCR